MNRSKYIVDEIDVQISNRDNAGEFELEAYPMTEDENGLHETEMGISLALDHETGDLPEGVDDDRWLEVTRSERPNAPKGLSEEVWERFLDVAFGKLKDLTGIGECESCGEAEAFSGADECYICGGCDDCGRFLHPGDDDGGVCIGGCVDLTNI